MGLSRGGRSRGRRVGVDGFAVLHCRPPVLPGVDRLISQLVQPHAVPGFEFHVAELHVEHAPRAGPPRIASGAKRAIPGAASWRSRWG